MTVLTKVNPFGQLLEDLIVLELGGSALLRRVTSRHLRL
jgi:hypothetical protein